MIESFCLQMGLLRIIRAGFTYHISHIPYISILYVIMSVELLKSLAVLSIY